MIIEHNYCLPDEKYSRKHVHIVYFSCKYKFWIGEKKKIQQMPLVKFILCSFIEHYSRQNRTYISRLLAVISKEASTIRMIIIFMINEKVFSFLDVPGQFRYTSMYIFLQKHLTYSCSVKQSFVKFDDLWFKTGWILR